MSALCTTTGWLTVQLLHTSSIDVTFLKCSIPLTTPRLLASEVCERMLKDVAMSTCIPRSVVRHTQFICMTSFMCQETRIICSHLVDGSQRAETSLAKISPLSQKRVSMLQTEH